MTKPIIRNFDDVQTEMNELHQVFVEALDTHYRKRGETNVDSVLLFSVLVDMMASVGRTIMDNKTMLEGVRHVIMQDKEGLAKSAADARQHIMVS